MKNSELKPLKPPKNKRKTVSSVIGFALAFCSILAPFTPYTAKADVQDEDINIPTTAYNDYYRHPLAGYSIQCSDINSTYLNVFDCPTTYGGSDTVFDNRLDFNVYTAWQNTRNGTFALESKDVQYTEENVPVFDLVGVNIALVEEFYNNNAWRINTGQMQYNIKVEYKPIFNTGSESKDYYQYTFTPSSYYYDGNYVFNFGEIFDNIVAEAYSDNGTALFDWISIKFIPYLYSDEYTASLTFYNAYDVGSTGSLSTIRYSARVNVLYKWIYNGSPIETILDFPINFLKTEIFPDFSFGALLLVALGVLVFSLGLKIAFGG